MSVNDDARLTRRGFLTVAGTGAAGALVIGAVMMRPGLFGSRPGSAADAGDGAGAATGTADAAATSFAPNIWLSIDADGETTIALTKAEMGQGVYTALPMLIAEELDADWKRIRVVQADLEPRYAPFIGTGGSSSVSSSFDPLRKAGAAAREMLIAAAAARWNVPAGECPSRNTPRSSRDRRSA
jgi:isoquinoline 1-oxidoreductase subunit beta